jgi:hypothetical protein
VVNKGGTGSETAGKNMNYGIWMTSSGQIQAGFESSSGSNKFVTSSLKYNDGLWHYAVVTYSGTSLTLYLDGVKISNLSTSSTPDKTGTQPLRIGANSLSLNDFFVGEVDEVRVWNRALSASEVVGQYNSGTFSVTGQVAYLSFPTGQLIAQDIVASTGQSLWSGRQVHAEYLSSSSVLVGKQIDSIIFKLKKTGSPTGLASIGIINADLTIKKLFGTIDVSKISTSYTDYEVNLAGSEPYTLAAGDRIGIKYNGGSSSNLVSIMRDTDSADPFDGTRTYRTQYESSWQTSTSQDLYFILKLFNSGATGDTTPPVVTASPAGGTYSAPQLVTLTASETATIYYTTDGNNPTTSSPVYSSPISVTTTATLKFFGVDAAGNQGLITTVVYTIDTVPPTISVSPTGGSYTGIQSVALTANEPSTIYYTTDGSDPDPTSLVYTSPIQLSTDTTLKFYGIDGYGNAGEIMTEVYSISSEPSVPIDAFGVQKIYPTKDGKEWYVSMDNPASDPYFKNLQNLQLALQPDGSWRVAADNGQVRMEAWSPVDAKWQDVEITMYAKIEQTTNPLLQMYTRGGHHTTSDPCLGSAFKARLYGDGRAGWVKEVTHPAYTSTIGFVQATNEALEGRWVGFKAVVYNFIENGKTFVRMESYIDDDVTDSNGNLVIKNNWTLASVTEDKGGWTTTNTDFTSTCSPMSIDNTGQYRQRDEILSMPGGTATQNIAAWRTDGTIWDFKYLSVREIQTP